MEYYGKFLGKEREQPMERKVFTYKDVEEARGWIGKAGTFYDLEWEADFHQNGWHSKLMVINGACGQVFVDSLSAVWRYFVPDPTPVEKWVPFTAEDWPKIIGAVFKHKGIGYPLPIFVPVGVANDGVAYAKSGGFAVLSFQDFLDTMEFADGTPCGKKVVE